MTFHSNLCLGVCISLSFISFVTVSADITVCLTVFLNLSGFSFFIKFQACLLDQVKSIISIVSFHLFFCFLEGMP